MIETPGKLCSLCQEILGQVAEEKLDSKAERCTRCGSTPDALIHHGTANAHPFAADSPTTEQVPERLLVDVLVRLRSSCDKRHHDPAAQLRATVALFGDTAGGRG
jgi:ribosomal protein S27AE